jgi:hypothetical protein
MMIAASRVSRKTMKKIGTEKRFFAIVEKGNRNPQEGKHTDIYGGEMAVLGCNLIRYPDHLGFIKADLQCQVGRYQIT